MTEGKVDIGGIENQVVKTGEMLVSIPLGILMMLLDNWYMIYIDGDKICPPWSWWDVNRNVKRLTQQSGVTAKSQLYIGKDEKFDEVELRNELTLMGRLIDLSDETTMAWLWWQFGISNDSFENWLQDYAKRRRSFSRHKIIRQLPGFCGIYIYVGRVTGPSHDYPLLLAEWNWAVSLQEQHGMKCVVQEFHINHPIQKPKRQSFVHVCCTPTANTKPKLIKISEVRSLLSVKSESISYLF